MSSWWSCACAPKVEAEFTVAGEETAEASCDIGDQKALLLGRTSSLVQSPKAGTKALTSSGAELAASKENPDEELTPSTTRASSSDPAEKLSNSASSATLVEEGGQTLSEANDAIPHDEASTMADDAARIPDVRSMLSGSELAAVKALEHELGNEGLDAVRAILVPGEALESCLLRFLKPNNLRPRPAAKALRAHLTWRGSVKPADLAPLAPGEICGCPDELLEKYMPTWHQGYDRQGRPVVFSHYGKFRFGPVLEAGVTVEKILQLHVRNSENTARLCGKQSSKLGRDVPNALIIMDTEGWDPNNLRSKGAFEWARGLAKIDQEHYPERMGQLLIINAPSSVHYFYKAASWMLPEKARNQVRILGGRETWEPALLELIEASQLPPQYGGTGPDLALATAAQQ